MLVLQVDVDLPAIVSVDLVSRFAAGWCQLHLVELCKPGGGFTARLDERTYEARVVFDERFRHRITSRLEGGVERRPQLLLRSRGSRNSRASDVGHGDIDCLWKVVVFIVIVGEAEVEL